MKTAIQIEIMRNMRQKGYTLQQIGDTFQITRERVRQILDKKLDNAKLKANKGRPS